MLRQQGAQWCDATHQTESRTTHQRQQRLVIGEQCVDATEGTTSDGYSLLPFKPALLAGLMPPPRDLQIQPVWIDYGPATPEIAWHGDEAAGANAARVLAREGALPLTLHFLEPFDPEDFPDRKAVAEEARNRIMARQSASLSSRAAV